MTENQVLKVLHDNRSRYKERSRKVLFMHFCDYKMQADIARELGMLRAHVSQIVCQFRKYIGET